MTSKSSVATPGADNVLYEEVIDYRDVPSTENLGYTRSFYKTTSTFFIVVLAIVIFLLTYSVLKASAIAIMFLVANLLWLNSGRYLIRIAHDLVYVRCGVFFPFYWKRIRISQIRKHRVATHALVSPFRFANWRGPTWGRFTRIDGEWAFCLIPGSPCAHLKVLGGATIERGVLIGTDRWRFMITSRTPEQLDAVIGLALEQAFVPASQSIGPVSP